MLSRWFLQGASFPNMLTQTTNAIVIPAVSGCLIVVEKKPFGSSWRNSIFDAKKSTNVDAIFSARSYSSCKLQKFPLLFGAGDLKLQVFSKSTKLGSRSFACFRKMNDVSNLRNLRSKHSCSYISSKATSSLPDGNSGSRMSRTERTDAQNALFDYLHYTRCLNFTDAEHISKNSPVFLQSLLAKVNDGEEVGRSVSRFLRFTPINEFEPFFESLGLKPSELYALLPHNLIYLTDDHHLIENYHVLCNYGVPRSKIGKMYKEGSEMFRYNHGVLNSKLQSYERLGLSKPTIIKLVTCCPALLIGELNRDFLEVLTKLKALGVELDLVRGCLSDKSVYHWDRILKMLNFLDGMGCNQKNLETLINQHPRFVFDDSGKKIYILVALLLKLGIKMDDILLLFVQYPQILAGNFVKNLWQSIYFLVDIGMSVEDIKMIVKTHPHVLGASSSKSPYFVLQRLKLSEHQLCDIIKEDPNQFTYLITSKKSSAINLPKVEGTFLREKTDFLLRLGFVENSDEMARVLKKFRGRGDQLQKRFDFLVEIGLDCHTAAEMIKAVPPVLNQSIDVLDKKSTYLLNDLGYPLEALAAFPTFLCYNLDKIKLRFSMFQWLKENGVSFSTKNRKLASPTVALSTVLACSDARFFKYFVNLHHKGPEEWERLKRSFSSK
ncbi:hypothetical protein KFK09_014786 [Dendrobium nobile]|uniref:Uncharacterized protein n=1 Tax=Dendrobium nobile TaxID=94219 RepID=A0A8T3B5E9_DENNO|nr:hypothetical protein KFK09_014786 [Dendrobium nobile]